MRKQVARKYGTAAQGTVEPETWKRVIATFPFLSRAERRSGGKTRVTTYIATIISRAVYGMHRRPMTIDRKNLQL